MTITPPSKRTAQNARPALPFGWGLFVSLTTTMVAKDIKKQNPLTTAKQRLWISIVLICITSLFLYNKSVKNDFLDLDDMTIIVNNYDFLHDFSNVGQVFKQGAFKVQGADDTLTSYYRPMMILSFMTDAHLSPKKSEFPTPRPFIEANIFYHTVACILLLLLLLEFKIPPIPSMLLSLIFTVHPLLNQAVAWIPGRNDSLLTIFILASFIYLLQYLKTKKNSLLVFHLLLFLLALFTKENALMLVPVLFVYLRFVRREKSALKTYLILGAGYLLCIIPWFIMRHIALSTNADRSTLTSISHTIFSNMPYFVQYLSKSVLPFNLSVMTVALDTNYLIGLLAIGLLLAGILLSKKKSTALVIFGLCWFLFFLTPSFFSSFNGLEHRAYLPLVGIIITASQFDIIKAADYKGTAIQSKIGLVVLCGIFLAFFSVSFKRLPIFENRYAFDKSAMETSPHALLPCVYLAAHYEQENLLDKAVGVYQEAIKRDSTYEIAYRNMGGDYIRMNMFPEAERILRLDVARNPTNSIATFNLGLVVFQGDHNDSMGVRLWKKAITLDSNFAQPYKVLSQYYQATGDSATAMLYRNFYLKKSPTQ